MEQFDFSILLGLSQAIIYSLTLLFSFGESLAFIGVVIPGTTFVLLAGFGAAQDVLDLRWLIAVVFVGAVFGDVVSYFVGAKCHRFFTPASRFLKFDYIEKGKKFFIAHGSKSVFLGRFAGPMRAVVPFIAGLTQMKFKTFFIWDVLSSLAWAVSFTLLGFFFGHAYRAIAMWTTRAGSIVLVLILFVILAVFLVRRSKPFVAFSLSLWAALFAWRKFLKWRKKKGIDVTPPQPPFQ